MTENDNVNLKNMRWSDCCGFYDPKSRAWSDNYGFYVPQESIEGDEIVVPTFPKESEPTVSLYEISKRRFYIVERAQAAAREDSRIYYSISKSLGEPGFGAGIARIEGLVGILEISAPDEELRPMTFNVCSDSVAGIMKKMEEELLKSLQISSQLLKTAPINLKDDTQKKSLWLQLHEKGVLSKTTLMEKFNLDYDKEIELLRKEADLIRELEQAKKESGYLDPQPAMFTDLKGSFADPVKAMREPACFSAEVEGLLAVDEDPVTFGKPVFYSPLHWASCTHHSIGRGFPATGITVPMVNGHAEATVFLGNQ